MIRSGNGKCTHECGKENKNDSCIESDDHCSCFDDVGKLWKANETETIEHECSEYQPNLNGKLFFIKVSTRELCIDLLKDHEWCRYLRIPTYC